MPRRPTDSAAPLLDLHPVLQTTLHYMDVRLEDELARYRRARRRSPVQSRWGEGQPIMTPETSRLDAAPVEAAALAIAPNLAANLQPDPEPTVPLPPEAPSEPFTPLQSEGYADYLESSEHLLRSLAEDEAELRTAPAPRMMDTLLTPLGVGSMVLLLLSSVTLGYIITNPSGLPFMGAKAPADDTGTVIPTTPDAATSANNEPSSFYPDLSSQEFRDLNLDTLSTIPEDGTQPTPSASSTVNPSQSVTVPRTPVAPSVAATAPSQSSRAATTPANRSTPATQRNATASTSRAAAPASRTASRPAASPRPTRPAASPRPAAPARSAAPAPRPAPAAARPAPSPSRPAAASRPAPARPAPTTVAAAPTRPTTYYYVVTDYTGDRSLATARQAVSDAYVRNFEIGAVVQFGAFQEQGRAQSLLQDLQQQGIQARIYRAESN